MISYTETLATPHVLDLFRQSQRVVSAIPDTVSRNGGGRILISCHHVARIVERLVGGLVCIDGHFIKGYAHSWLAIPRAKFIIDPYPVAIVQGPLLLCMTLGSPWPRMYVTERKPQAIFAATFQADFELILAATAKNL